LGGSTVFFDGILYHFGGRDEHLAPINTIYQYVIDPTSATLSHWIAMDDYLTDYQATEPILIPFEVCKKCVTEGIQNE
jgi:hypothetical protein